MFIAALGLGVASLGFLIAAIVGSSQIWQWPAIGCALIGLVLLIVDHIRYRGASREPEEESEPPRMPNRRSSHSHHRRQDPK